jgi:hypothetical protein
MSASRLCIGLFVLAFVIAASVGEGYMIGLRDEGAVTKQVAARVASTQAGILAGVWICNDNECQGPAP